MANVAVIQGSSRGLGLAFAQHLLKNTSLNVCATSRDPSAAKKAILDGLDKSAADRLTALELDVLREDSIAEAAKQVQEKHGKNTLRLLINVSGILRQEKSILKVSEEDFLETLKINTIGHVLTFKHFVPLLPSKKSKESDYDGNKDPANGLVQPGLSVLASMSAKVGSISDNRAGGWYSYRSSKSALNQCIVSLNRELSMRSAADSIALALHPGTVAGTELSGQVVGKEQRGSKQGVHGPEEAVEGLLKTIGKQGPKDGGRFLAYNGEELPW